MKDIALKDVRTFAFMGHTGSGKTSLVDAILFKLGLNDRIGTVDNGSSAADYTDEEKERKISIFAKPFEGIYDGNNKSVEFTFVDTPGYFDFYGQVASAAKAVATGVIVIDASSGIQVGTRRAMNCAVKKGLSKGIVITGMDKENVDFDKTVLEIKTAFGELCVPVVVPTEDGGVVDVLASDSDETSEYKTALVEIAAETDDTLIEKYFEGEPLTPEEIAAGLHESIAEGSFVPIFVASGKTDTGIDEFLEGVIRLFPAPSEVVHLDVDGNEIPPQKDKPFVGFVWRSVNDPFVGQLSFVRVLAGTLTPDSEIYNSVQGVKEKVGPLMVMNGKKQTPVFKACAGDIIAIPKLKSTKVNDTLCAVGTDVKCSPIEFPKPVMFQAVWAKTQSDEDKIGIALQRVVDDDPTLSVEHNKETHEVILKGLGDVHIDVAVNLMKRRSKVNVDLTTPKVPYREAVRGLGEGHHKHKKQSGGHGQYGEVYLKVEPLLEGDDEWFVNAIVGGVIPGNYIPAVEKGVLEGKASGALAGFPVEDVKVTVYDGTYHPVDSSEVAFKIAASKAFAKAMAEAKPVLLEPVMQVKVTIPDHYMGDINGDLNHKRGRILGVEVEDGMQIIIADVPMSELFRYAAELRSITSGQGTFEMNFSRYDVVPSNIAQKVIDASKKDDE
jgi:elongation factor G